MQALKAGSKVFGRGIPLSQIPECHVVRAQVLKTDYTLSSHGKGEHATRGKPEKGLFKWSRPGQELGSRRPLTLNEAISYQNKLKRKKH